MCSSCVSRLFTSGPAPCPVAGCHRTLRKRGFHTAYFADLTIEREVDIRKRVGKVFNRRENDFETLLDWNNYLEEVENLTFDLIDGGPKERAEAEKKLKAYEEGNKQDIAENENLSLQERDLAKAQQEEEKEAARRRRAMALQEEQAEKEDLARSKRDVIDALASGTGDAKAITERAQKVILKKSSARRNMFAASAESNGSAEGNLTIRGLKKRVPVAEEEPYDPFGGVVLKEQRYALQGRYENQWLDFARGDDRHMAGGYSLGEYYARTMFEAFSGLGVFVEDEVTGRGEGATAGVGTAAAVAAAGGES
jgi:CDK-activating kinase assembly factor MAT1